MFLTEERLTEYKELRVSRGLPNISDQEATDELQPLIDFAEFAWRFFAL